jgi:predicted transcriptional regulator
VCYNLAEINTKTKEKKMDFVADSTVNKLILLFVMDKMEIPLTENSIIDITTSRNTWLNYMDCKDVLWQLIEVGFVYKTVDANTAESRYNITYEGRNALSHFFLKIPSSLREEITNFAKNNRMQFKRAQEYVGDYYKNADGSHTAVLRIREPLEPSSMFEIKLKLPSRHAAIVAVKKWKEKAPNIYETIYGLLEE